MDVDKSISGKASYGCDPTYHRDFLSGGKAGSQIDHVGIGDLCCCRIVVQLKGEGPVSNGDDPAEKLNSVVFLQGNPIVDSALDYAHMHGSWVQWLWLCHGQLWNQQKADRKRRKVPAKLPREATHKLSPAASMRAAT